MNATHDWLIETLRSLMDGVLAFDADWNFVFVNTFGERVLGRPSDQLLGKNLWQEFPELEGTPFGLAYRRAKQEQTLIEVQDYYPPFDAWFEARTFPTERGMTILFRDISARKRAEEEREAALAGERASREAAERGRNLLDRILENTGMGIIVADATGTLRIFNPEAERQHGASHAEVTAPDWAKTYGLLTLTGEPLPLEETPLFRAVQGEEVRGARWRVKRPDGEVRTLSGTASPLRELDGRVAGAVLVTEDVTALERAHERQERQARLALLVGDVGAALTRSENLRPMLQQCADAMVCHLDAALARIWTVDFDAQVLVLRASGGQSTDIEGPQARIPIGKFEVGRIAEDGTPHLTNDVFADPPVSDEDWARREGMVAFVGYPLKLGARVIGVLAMFSREHFGGDTLEALASITDAIALGIQRRLAEEARRESETRYRLATQATKDAIWDWDLVSDRVTWNEGIHDLFGYGRDEVLPEAAWWCSKIHAADRDRVVADIHGIIERGGQRWQGEYRFLRRDGLYAIVTDRGFISHDEVGRSVRMVGAMQDVTAPRRVEQERENLIRSLERSNKELDQFAYVASHDLKAPLRGIANLSEWLEEDLADVLTEEAREQMRLLRGRVLRLEGLINGILSYSRAGRAKERPELVDVGLLLAEVIELLAPEPGREVVVTGDMPSLTAERTPLQQVFLNLISNALKHGARHGGRVEIGVEDRLDRWEFFVRDDGPGITGHFHERIWGIFQTLEARDKVEGTGIGLSVVRKIVEWKGGRAWVESEPGRGATFRFTWPKRSEGKEYDLS